MRKIIPEQKLDQRTSYEVRKKMERNDALDITKGILVVFMVLYHWINYFVVPTWDVYRYLRFITPSFILITGFIVSNIYLRKYSIGDPQLHRRLLNRGLKLLMLFTLLNCAGSVLMNENHDGYQSALRSFVSHADQIYLLGSSRAAFDVLVPISYFLLLAPLILIGSYALSFSLAAAGIAAVLFAIVANLLGVRSTNLELLSIAMLGMGVGSQSLSRFNGTLRHPWLLIAAYVLYLTAITVWNIVFPLQVIGVCLSVLLVYLGAARCGSSGAFQQILIELGNYSLFAYIGQILVLQLLRRASRGLAFHATELGVAFVATLVLTVVGVKCVAIFRRKSVVVDRLYRVVFA